MDKRLIPSLTYEELEKICEIAEEAARRYIFSRVKKEYVSDISILVDLESLESLNVNIEVEVRLSPFCRSVNAKEIAEGSVRAAFETIEKFLKDIRMRSEEVSEWPSTG